MTEPYGEIRQRGMKMDKKITDEKLKAYSESGQALCDTDILKKVALAFLAERAECAKNPGVWDGAPECSDEVELYYKKFDEGYFVSVPVITYTRELPKTRAREIAEKWEKRWYKADGKSYADNIEAAILEYAEGLK